MEFKNYRRNCGDGIADMHVYLPHKEQHVALVHLNDQSPYRDRMKNQMIEKVYLYLFGLPIHEKVYRVSSWDGKFFIPNETLTDWEDISSQILDFNDEKNTQDMILGTRFFVGMASNIKPVHRFLKYPENMPELQEHEVYVIPCEGSRLYKDFDEFPIKIKTWDGKFWIPDGSNSICSKETGGYNISDNISMFYEEDEEVYHCDYRGE